MDNGEQSPPLTSRGSTAAAAAAGTGVGRWSPARGSCRSRSRSRRRRRRLGSRLGGLLFAARPLGADDAVAHVPQVALPLRAVLLAHRRLPFVRSLFCPLV